jgi:hypothetical protein
MWYFIQGICTEASKKNISKSWYLEDIHDLLHNADRPAKGLADGHQQFTCIGAPANQLPVSALVRVLVRSDQVARPDLKVITDVSAN